MANEHVEIPDPHGGGRPEGLGPVTPLNRKLYLAVIWILGLVLLVGVVGWLALALDDRSLPEGLAAILGTVAGGLVGLIADRSER